MEVYLFLTLAGVGYMLNRSRKPTNHVAPAGSVPHAAYAGDAPSGRDVYESRYLQDVHQDEARRAASKAAAAMHPTRSGVLPDGRAGGHGGAPPPAPRRSAPPPAVVHSTLSGVSMQTEHFTHNNMVPFYGGRGVGQSTRPEGFANVLGLFTGEDPDMRPAGQRGRDPAPLFKPMRNAGEEDMLDTHREARMAQMPESRKRVGPAPMVVGRPGVKGGESGDVYYDMRQHALPRSTDELRPKDRPKTTFEGRVLPGIGSTSQRAPMAAFEQNRPSMVAEQDHSALIRTPGAYVSETRRPDLIEVRETARQNSSMEYIGAPGVGSTSRGEVRADASRAPFRSSLGESSRGPATTAVPQVTDYGLSSIAVYANERDTTTTRTYQGNLATAVKSLVAPLQDLVRATRKEDYMEAPRAFGNAGTAVVQPKLTVYDANDVARTTIRETGLSEATAVNLAGASRITVYDPEDVARTTIKQTGVVEASLANLRGDRRAATLYDPEDVARTARKETTLHEAAALNLAGREAMTVYDPEDVARTGVKETTLYDGTGSMQMQASMRRGTAFDPEDVQRTTGRETLDASDHVRNPGAARSVGKVYDPDAWRPDTTTKQMLTDAGKGDYDDGHVGGLQGRRGGYATAEYEAHTTHKQLLADSGINYGGAAVNKAGGYETAPDDLRESMRAMVADTDYFGAGGPGAGAAQMSYADAGAARNDGMREVLEHGRDPTQSSVKLAAGVDASGIHNRISQRPQMLDTRDLTVGRIVAMSDGDLGDVTRDRNAYSRAVEDRVGLEASAAAAQLSSNPLALRLGR
jgi:hypothetical protein